MSLTEGTERRRHTMRKIAPLAVIAPLLLIASGVSFAQQAPPPAGAPPGAAGAGAPGGAARPAPPPFRVQSPDLVDGAILPQQFGCGEGANAVSPPLRWLNAPRGTENFVLIV